jgi:hypothetical protein
MELDDNQFMSQTGTRVARFKDKKVTGYTPVISFHYNWNPAVNNYNGTKVPMFMTIINSYPILVRSRYKAKKLADMIIDEAKTLDYKRDGHTLFIRNGSSVQPILVAGSETVHAVMNYMMEVHKGAHFMVLSTIDWNIQYRNQL